MTSVLDAPTRPSTTPASRLRTTTAAVRVHFTWLGVRKSLTPEQKSQAAESFGAEGQYLSAGKKLLDTRHPAYRKVTAVRGQIINYWKGMTLPYPESGIRLIRQADITSFDARMEEFRAELAEAVDQLDDHYGELKSAARDRLGSLYNPTDYPMTLRGWFSVEHDFPSIEPPEYLRQLHPDIFAQESQRVSARFEEAIRLAEQAFTEEFSRLVAHLCERISGEGDGQRKIFRDSAVNNLREFFERFRSLNVHSSEELDQLVEQAKDLVGGVTPQDLRDSATIRRQVGEQLSQVQEQLDALLVDRPRRRILRNGSAQQMEA